MKMYLNLLVALTIVPQFSLAQSAGDEFLSELDQTVESAQVNNVAPSASAALPTQSVSGQPIYILNQATPAATVQQQATTQQQAAVQKQPTTLIEASPVTESRAEAIRRARQDAEVETEQKIVEKLEAARMEDEKRRADALFGDKLNNLNQPQQAVQPVLQQPVQPVVVAAPVTVQEVQGDNTRDLVREEIKAAMDAEKDLVQAPTESRYFSALIGIGDYPDVQNVKGNYSLGAAFGTKYDDALIVEGAFLVSNYNVDTLDYYSATPLYSVDVNQYSGALAAKYQLFSGMVRPVVGGLVQYSYRTFSWSDNAYYGAYSDETATSHAIDVGAIAGADLEFSPKFSLGFDFRYMINMSSRTSGAQYWYGNQGGTPIEKLQYYVMGLAARVNF